MITRRGFMASALTLLATPAFVRAGSLYFVPRHSYFVYFHHHNGLVDFVRSDGRLVGWLLPSEIRQSPTSTPRELLEMATTDIKEKERQTAQQMYYSEGIFLRRRMPLEVAHRQFTQTQSFG